MSAMPNLAKPMEFIADPLGIMPKSMRQTIADPLGLVIQPDPPKPPSQQQLYDTVQSQQAARRAAAIDSANSTNASLSRPSMGASYLGG